SPSLPLRSSLLSSPVTTLLAPLLSVSCIFFFFNDPAPPEIYPLSLHDALPILLPVSSGSKQGGLAPGVASVAGPTEAGRSGDGGIVARRACGVSLGPSGRPHPQQPGPARGVAGAAAPRGTPERDDAPPGCGWPTAPGAGALPEGHPELLARTLGLRYGA